MRYRVNRYRLLLVKDGASITTTWDRQVREARDVADFMAPLVAQLDREVFHVLFLNGRNTAILANAAAIILVHNHPSGQAEPSAEDRALTKRLSEVGDLVGIRVLDHIVLGDGGAFCSLADDGLLPGEASWK